MPKRIFSEMRAGREIMRRRNYTYPSQHLVSLVNELPNVGDDACPHFLQFLPPKVGVVNAHLVQGFCFLDLCGVGSRAKGGESHQDGKGAAKTQLTGCMGVTAAGPKLVTLACASSQERRRFSSCLLALLGLTTAALWYSSSALALRYLAFSSSSQRCAYCRRDLRRDDKDSFLDRQRNRVRDPHRVRGPHGAAEGTNHSRAPLARKAPASSFKGLFQILSSKHSPFLSSQSSGAP